MRHTYCSVIVLLLILVFTFAADIVDPNDFPEARFLLGTGSNRYGQLGQYDTATFMKAPLNFTVSKFCVVNQNYEDREEDDAFATNYEPKQYHAVAVDTNLDVYSWGYGSPGQGSPDRLDTSVNTKVPQYLFNIQDLAQGSTSVTMMVCGANHAVLITNDNRVIVFGSHSKGQLGIGTNATLSSAKVVPPMRAPTLEALNIKKIWAVADSTFLVTASDVTYGFGDNQYYQLGMTNAPNEPTFKASPVTLFPYLPTADKVLKDVTGGAQYTIFLVSTGNVYASGLDQSGFVLGLGHSSTVPQYNATLVAGAAKAEFISSQGSTTVATLSDGTILAWGKNNHKQVCTSDVDMNKPTAVSSYSVPSGSTVIRVSLTRDNLRIHYRDSLNKDMFLVCGNNTFGSLGVLDATTKLPVNYLNSSQWTTVSFETAVADLYSLDAATFAVDTTGSVYVVGDVSRAPGVPDYYTNLTDITIYSDDKTSTLMLDQIAAGDEVSASIERTTGKLFVWGAQKYPIAFLTAGLSKNHVYKPLQFPGLKGQNVSSIVIGGTSVSSGDAAKVPDLGYVQKTFFAILNDTTKVYTWGSNEYYQLGMGYRNVSTQATVIPRLIKFRSNVTRVHKISPSGRHVIALTYEDTGNTVVDPNDPFAQRETFDFTVFGSNLNGQLGMGGAEDIGTPLRVSVNAAIRDITVGDLHSARVDANYVVASTGTGPDGRLGAGILYDTTSFRQVGSTLFTSNVTITKVFAGATSTFFVSSTGAVYATGSNKYGALGFPSTITEVNTPTLVPGLTSGVLKISSAPAGGAHTLFLKTDGSVYVTGRNHKGQLGLGDTVDRYGVVQITVRDSYVGLEVSAGKDHSLILIGQRKCSNDCSGRGDCNRVLGQCECGTSASGTAYIGSDCSLRQCEDPKCSGHGTCQLDRGICKCDTGFKGAKCDLRKCPNNCSGSLRGKCDTSTGRCDCNQALGFTGKDCSVSGDAPKTASSTVFVMFATLVTLVLLHML